MFRENSTIDRICFSLDKGAAANSPQNNTPGAADLVDRCLSGDQGAFKQFFKIKDPIYIEDMPGQLGEFDTGKATGAGESSKDK
jgi:hypothetical protein